MTSKGSSWSSPRRLMTLGAALLANGVVAENVLNTVGLSNCGPESDIKVNRADISYDHSDKQVTFDLSGTSNKVQNVTALLSVTAYGEDIFEQSFNPCDTSTFVGELCPVPSRTFSAKGTLEIPSEFADMVPGIAFQVPDIAAFAKLELKAQDSDETVACIQSQVSNGKTANLAAVSYVAAGIAGAALIASGLGAAGSALAGGSTAGTGTPSPSFTETIHWFQGMAMNGMLSVNYPPVYRSFTENFAFSTGLVPWTQMQVSIDNFRSATGGNLTQSSVEVLQNATLVFPDGSTHDGNAGAFGLKAKRALYEFGMLMSRQVDTSVDEDDSSDDENGFPTTVSGMQAYVERLSVPKTNVFMTVFLVFAIIIAAIIVGILLLKVVLEIWALFGSFPKGLAGFRQHYWGSMARTITQLILLLYGIWTIYCVYQFTNGDSWGAITVAAVTLAAFTGILAFFTWKIWYCVKKLKESDGDASGLYEKKEVWMKYSLFYESYKRDYWWLFIPLILYMLAKGIVIAAGNGHGLSQASAQLAIEAVMLGLLIWKKPFERKSGNVLNIAIAVVRVVSVCCILVFVERFAISQTTQTVTGVVLIAVQAALTGLLAILICWNAINACCKKNRHRKRRKEMEKRQRDLDDLTPLDARNSLLLDRKDPEAGGPNGETTYALSNTVEKKGADNVTAARSTSPEAYDPDAVAFGDNNFHTKNGSNGSNGPFRALTPGQGASHRRSTSREGLMRGAAPIGGYQGLDRQPTVPDVGGGNVGWAQPYSDNPQPGYGQYRAY